jgi:hypothetical protein
MVFRISGSAALNENNIFGNFTIRRSPHLSSGRPGSREDSFEFQAINHIIIFLPTILA